MKAKLLKLTEVTNPKKISQAVKSDQELYDWVSQQFGVTISEKIYNSLYTDSIICENGNQKKFKSISEGYKFCGKANQCLCAKKSVSCKVSSAKSQYTEQQKEQILEKRINTNLTKYGIANTGQLEHSKNLHKGVYSNIDKVDKINQQVKDTKTKKYSNPNYNNSNKIKETFRQKRINGFWVNKFPEKNIQVLENKKELEELYKKYLPGEIAEQLNVHIQTVYKYLNAHKLRDPFKSSEETDLVRYIESLGITNIIRNTRKLLQSRKEIDIYLPDYKIAIEYNGVYWHHEDIPHITRDYHYNKFLECEQQGIQLITIFSNFWLSKKEIVKNTLKIKLNQYTGQSIYARKCKIDYVDTILAKDFLNKHHIQGYTPSTTRIGLFFNNDLVALMTFSKNRIGIGQNNLHTELVRFASSGRIVGAASKLLSFYKKQNPCEVIISYSDNEWSTGNLYKKLGFRLDSDIKYSYWYLKPKEHRLYHRFTYSKQKLVKQGHDPLKTESQITKELGLLKVWDCGKRKWRLD